MFLVEKQPCLVPEAIYRNGEIARFVDCKCPTSISTWSASIYRSSELSRLSLDALHIGRQVRVDFRSYTFGVDFRYEYTQNTNDRGQFSCCYFIKFHRAYENEEKTALHVNLKYFSFATLFLIGDIVYR